MIKVMLIFLVVVATANGCVQDHEKPLKPIMYGSYTCPHCIEQKKLINASDYEYVECNINGGQSKACREAHIEVYPTWIFPNGERIEGVIDQEQFRKLIS